MSVTVIPTLVGLGIDVRRSPVFSTTVQTATSGKETRIANQSSPRYKWNVQFNVLRSAGGWTEFQQLFGFFNSMKGSFDTFLYTDADDNSATATLIGTGNGVQTVFQLVRTFGGFIEPILAPNVVSAVYLNGVLESASNYTVLPWGTGSANGPGNIVFNTAPAGGVVVTADLTFYWPCRMQDDTADFEMFLSRYYRVPQFAFISVKN